MNFDWIKQEERPLSPNAASEAIPGLGSGRDVPNSIHNRSHIFLKARQQPSVPGKFSSLPSTVTSRRSNPATPMIATEGGVSWTPIDSVQEPQPQTRKFQVHLLQVSLQLMFRKNILVAECRVVRWVCYPALYFPVRSV